MKYPTWAIGLVMASVVATAWADTPDISADSIQATARDLFEVAIAHGDGYGLSVDRAEATCQALIDNPKAMSDAPTATLSKLFAALCTGLTADQRQSLSLSFDQPLTEGFEQADPDRLEVAAWLRAVSDRSDEQTQSVWSSPKFAEILRDRLPAGAADETDVPSPLGPTSAQARLAEFSNHWRQIGAWLDSDRPLLRRYALAAILSRGIEPAPAPAELLGTVQDETLEAAVWQLEIVSWSFRQDGRLTEWRLVLSINVGLLSDQKVLRGLILAYLDEIEPGSVNTRAGDSLRRRAFADAETDTARFTVVKATVQRLLIREEYAQARSLVQGAAASSGPQMQVKADAVLLSIDRARQRSERADEKNEVSARLARRLADKQWLSKKLERLDAEQPNHPVRDEIISGLAQIEAELADLSNQIEILRGANP